MLFKKCEAMLRSEAFCKAFQLPSELLCELGVLHPIAGVMEGSLPTEFQSVRQGSLLSRYFYGAARLQYEFASLLKKFFCSRNVSEHLGLRRSCLRFGRGKR